MTTTFEHLAPLVRLEIEDDGLLVRVEELVATATLDAGFVVEPGAEAADGVAAGPLDLDDASAEVGEELGRVRAGDVRRQVEDGDPVEGGRRGGVSRHVRFSYRMR